MKSKNLLTLLLLFSTIGLFAQTMMMHSDNKGNITKAICELYPTQGNVTQGTVTFEMTDEGMQVTVKISGLTPGKHGFHIHEYGDCTAPDGTSAGGHFNPSMHEHAGPNDAIRHEGDMGNVTADANGNVSMEYIDKMLTFSGDSSIIGRGIIVHADEDDLKTQPTGNAGPRVACGVIGVAK